MGDSAQSSAPAASRLPPLRTAVGKTSLAASLASLAPELLQFAQATDIVGGHLDEKTVRRSYRTWSEWIDRRADEGNWGIVVDAALAKPLAKLIPKGAVIAELCSPHLEDSTDLPWPRVACPKLPGASQPLPVRLLIIVDPVALAIDARLLAMLHREAILSLSAAGSAPFGVRPALGGIIVDTSNAITARPQQFVLDAGADSDIGTIIDRIFAAANLATLRMAASAADRFTFAATLVRDEEALRKIVSAVPDAHNELQAMLADKEAIEKARVDISAVFERQLRKFRLSRGGIDTAKIALNAGQQDMMDLIGPFHPTSDEQITDMLDEKTQLNWWQGTPIEWLKWSFNKKYRVSLSENSLQQITGKVRDATVNQIKGATRRTKRDLTTALAEAAESHPVAAAPIEGTSPNMQSDAAKERSKQSVYAAFDGFTKQEARSFHVDMEDKGLIGQLSEARSAVFGLFFIVLMFSRPLELELLPKIMSYGMLVLMMVGLTINFIYREQRKKAQIYQRFEARLDDFRGRLAALVEKVVKDELSLVDIELSENSASVDDVLARMQTAVQAQIERSGAGTAAGRGFKSSAPAAPNSLLADAQTRIALRSSEALEKRFRESFAKDFAEQLA